MNDASTQVWCEAMSSGDADTALTLYSPTATFEDVPFQMTASGADLDLVMRSFVGSGDNTFTYAG
ncbi:MAG: hypothetical protein ACI8Y4_003383 [Candidatus Poriferisodalaceae bacterium]|jgi:hypothetical protein